MTDRFMASQESAIPFPIPESFERQAKAYASQYFNQDVQQRVYCNTLALLVADRYFHLLGLQTTLNNPERWNALHRFWSEANELELVGVGTLDCQAITREQQNVALPLERLHDASDNRLGVYLGYLFVEINSPEKSAVLVGFLPASQVEATDEVAIADLQSIDDLIDYLGQQDATASAEIDQIDSLTQEFAETRLIYLRNWLNHVYDPDWEPSMRDLQTVTCKKQVQLAGQTFEMQMSVSHSPDESLFVRVIIQGKNTNLPKGMQVSVPDESDIYTETVDEAADLISIPLELSQGEQFWVELRLGESVIREFFIA